MARVMNFLSSVHQQSPLPGAKQAPKDTEQQAEDDLKAAGVSLAARIAYLHSDRAAPIGIYLLRTMATLGIICSPCCLSV